MARVRKPPRPAELVAFAAVLMMPFYLGIVHWSALRFFAYAVIAAFAMATGEYLEATPGKRGSAGLFLHETMLWFLAVAGAGGAAYLVAWLF
jgi:hypothetical protein